MKYMTKLLTSLFCLIPPATNYASSSPRKPPQTNTEMQKRKTLIIEIVQERAWNHITQREQYLNYTNPSFQESNKIKANKCNEAIADENFYQAVLESLSLSCIQSLEPKDFESVTFTEEFCKEAVISLSPKMPKNFTPAHIAKTEQILAPLQEKKSLILQQIKIRIKDSAQERDRHLAQSKIFKNEERMNAWYYQCWQAAIYAKGINDHQEHLDIIRGLSLKEFKKIDAKNFESYDYTERFCKEIKSSQQTKGIIK